jgi:hypothetical protein
LDFGFLAIGLDVVAIALALGTGFYLYQTSAALKGDVVSRGMTILTIVPFLIAVNTLLDLASELGIVQLYGPIHYFARILFIVVLFVAARTIVQAWKNLS